jgi:hypothetical protein
MRAATILRLQQPLPDGRGSVCGSPLGGSGLHPGGRFFDALRIPIEAQLLINHATISEEVFAQ